MGTPRAKTKLSPWDIETLQLLADGNTVDSTAKLLLVSPNTIKSRLKSIMALLGTSCSEHSVAVACARGHLIFDTKEEPDPKLDRDPLNVLVLIARGKTRTEIAQDLGIAFTAVEKQTKALYLELDAISRCNLVYRGFLSGNLVVRKPEENRWTTKSPPPDSGDGSAPSSGS